MKIMIPKIIHQTGPTDKSKWNPVWFKCQESWQQNHPDYEYKFWNDEDLEHFMRDVYPEHYDVWKECPVHISRIDLTRYFILHHYGGVFSDLDIYSYKKIDNSITHDVMLMQALSEREIVGNCLMLGVKHHDFFEKCFLEAVRRLKRTPKKLAVDKFGHPNDIFANVATGPRLTSYMLLVYNRKHDVGILDSKHFVHDPLAYHENMVAKHMLTGQWGDEELEIMKRVHRMYFEGLSFEEFQYRNYEKFRNVDLHNYDFYVNKSGCSV
jgi:mannosyltransferase OCH1-like enzyme